MRICYFVKTMGFGGAERRVVLLANAAARAGHEAYIVVATGPGEFPEPVLPQVRIEVVGPGRFVPWGPWRLWRLLRRLRPDVFHGFLNIGNYLGCPVARLAGVPVVMGGLGTILPYHPLPLRWLARLAFGLTHHATANSRGVLEFYQHSFGFPATRLSVIPNPIRTADWPCRDAAMRAAVRAELGLAEHELAVVTVGRFMWKKGHTYLLDALATLDAALPVRFFLVGDGELRGALEAQADRLGLSQRVCFVGTRHDVPRFLQGMDLYCLPSVIEGMPNVVLEAMAAGLPTVATQVPGADELVIPQQTGWLAPPADAAALAQALGAALQDRTQLIKYGRSARQIVEQAFDEERVARLYFGLYQRLLGSPGSQ